MAKNPNWSEEELKLLREHYPTLGKSQKLQEFFPTRSLEGIALKANRIGLRVIHNIRQKKSNVQYMEECKSTAFIPLEEYRGSTIPILHRCRICSHEWKTRPQHVLTPGAGCPKCYNLTRKLSPQDVDKVLSEANISRESEYTGSLNPLRVKHTTCGHVWETKYSYIQQGAGCPVCNKGFGYLNRDTCPDTATLYLLKVDLPTFNQVYIKVGVTTRDPARRVSEIKSSILQTGTYSEISLVHCIKGTGREVLIWESAILNSKDIVRESSPIPFVGCKELISYPSLQHALSILKELTND